MNEILVLLFLSSAMLLGCYMAGMIPLVVSLSEVNMIILFVYFFPQRNQKSDSTRYVYFVNLHGSCFLFLILSTKCEFKL